MPPHTILARYAPALDALNWTRAGGGFSGADVFRGDDPAGTPVFALKAWPLGVTADRVSQIHAWVNRASRFAFVPAILPTADGSTFVPYAGRVWDVTRWMPGTPRNCPTVPEVEAACLAVAQLHSAWAVETRGPCPAVRARLGALTDFHAQFPTGPKLRADLSPPLHELLRRGWDVVARLAPGAERALRMWKAVPCDLRPCVRDLRGDHVLFTGSAVSGVIDFGATAVDTAASDLARLLGDLAADDNERFSAGLRAYRSVAALDGTDDFVRLLDRTGTLCSVVGWLVRFAAGWRGASDPNAVAARLGRLVERAGAFDSF